MKKFILKIAILCTLFIVLILFDFFVIGNQYEQNYQASIIDKIERLKSINEPKIILVGDSNVAFGFRSELIEKEFNMPVVNLGLHGGLSSSFHERMAMQNINRGDIVVLANAGYAGGNTIGNYELEWITLEKHKELWPIHKNDGNLKFEIAYFKYMFKCLGLFLTKKGNIALESSYSRKSFNKYGDNIGADKYESKYEFTKGSVNVPDVDEVFTKRINELNKFCQENGAICLIAGYPIGNGEFTPKDEEYIEFENKLKSLVDCPVISSFCDYKIDYKYFYDTNLHLNTEGAIIRTNQFIKDLKAFLGQ